MIKDILTHWYVLMHKLAFPHTTYRLRSFLSLGIRHAESLHKFKRQLGFLSTSLSIEEYTKMQPHSLESPVLQILGDWESVLGEFHYTTALVSCSFPSRGFCGRQDVSPWAWPSLDALLLALGFQNLSLDHNQSNLHQNETDTHCW